jgi:histidine ammonia-lyase
MDPIVIDRAPIGVGEVALVARARRPVKLGAEALQRLASGRALIERFLSEDKPVYGLTRGLGSRAVVSVAESERDDMSTVMLRARASGAGPRFEATAVRAFLFARLASMSQGRAGVRPVVAETLAAMLNAGVHPVVHEIGSSGASDMPLVAELALPVMGEGLAEYDGTVMPGGEAMQRAGIAPLQLKVKEGLGLCSANAVSAGLGALALCEARRLLALAEATAVLTFEAFRANLSPIDPRVVAARPAPGQAEAAETLRGYLSGSALNDYSQARRLQDPISLRCASHLFGALHAALDFTTPAVEVELNGAADNPAVLWETGDILSNGNFHTPALAQAFDLLALSLSQVASLGSQRVGRMMRKQYTDLPDTLSRYAEGTVRIGMGLLSFNARSLAKEVHLLAAPASVFDSSGYEVEDHEPMTPVAVRKFWRALPHWRQIIACELIVSAEAFDQRQPKSPAPVAVALRDAVRALVAPFDDDRSFSEDLEAIAALVASDRLDGVIAG